MIGALDVCNSYTNSRKMLTIVEVSSLYDIGKFLQEFGALWLKRRIHCARTTAPKPKVVERGGGGQR